MHARIQIYWCRSSIFRHLKLELLTQFPASNDEKYINVVYIWRKFVSFYGYVHWRMTTEISVMYGSEKVKHLTKTFVLIQNWKNPLVSMFCIKYVSALRVKSDMCCITYSYCSLQMYLFSHHRWIRWGLFHLFEHPSPRGSQLSAPPPNFKFRPKLWKWYMKNKYYFYCNKYVTKHI